MYSNSHRKYANFVQIMWRRPIGDLTNKVTIIKSKSLNHVFSANNYIAIPTMHI